MAARSLVLESIWYEQSALKWLLWPASGVYRLLVGGRRLAYRAGLLATVQLPVPVVVVGNISVGGTGKTPCIVWLAEKLRGEGLDVGVVSRGYGGRAPQWPQRVRPDSDPMQVGDEPVLIAGRTGCPVMVGPDRVAAARALLAETPVDVLLADDGLQHYRLGRQFEIAVVDGTRGLGNGWCLPAGPLREPPHRLHEVDAVVVNGGSWGGPEVLRARLLPTGARRLATGEEAPLETFRGRRVHALAGIGHPERFFTLLRDAGIEVVPHPLPDHARIEPEDLQFADEAPVLLTEKDAVKCRRFAEEHVWVVAAELVFDDDHGARLLRRVIGNLQRGASNDI